MYDPKLNPLTIPANGTNGKAGLNIQITAAINESANVIKIIQNLLDFVCPTKFFQISFIPLNILMCPL